MNRQNVTRLIAPIGRSRLNILAAIERVNPVELIAITTNQNYKIDEKGIKLATGLNDMKVIIRSLSNAFDVECVRNEMMAIRDEFPPSENDFTLISGSTNEISFLSHLLWPGKIVSIKRGLVSSIDEIDDEHIISNDSVLNLFGLQEIDGNLHRDGERKKLFPGSSSYYIDKLRGKICIRWDLHQNNFQSSLVNLRNHVEKKAELFGSNTFHHDVYSAKGFNLHEKIRTMVTIISEEEE
jgi:hypothetical protein